jgi:hypothetical protein
MSDNPFPFHCPFPQCSKKYTRKSILKEHLIPIRASGYDSNHSEADTLWTTDYVQSLLQRNSRRNNRSEEEKQAMRSARGARYYKRHRKAKLESVKARQYSINAAVARLRGI